MKTTYKCRICLNKNVSPYGSAKLRDMCLPCYKKNPKAITRGYLKPKNAGLTWDKKRKRMARCRSIMFRIFRHECMKCGANKPLEIDHIKPKSIYPELYDYLDNMQILCRSCNKQKGFTLESDYRKDSHKRIIRLYAEKHNSMSYIKDKKFGLGEL